MKDIIAYIETSTKEELPLSPITLYEAEDYLTDYGFVRYEGDGKWFEKEHDSYVDIKFWYKQINLTEHMVGFAEFKEGYTKIDQIYIKNENYRMHNPKDLEIFTIESLLDIYVKEKGIITE